MIEIRKFEHKESRNVAGTVAAQPAVPYTEFRNGDYRPATLLPDRWSITYQRLPGQDWTWSAGASGRRLKSDGTPGSMEASTYWREGDRDGDLPEWLVTLVADHHPLNSGGSIAAPFCAPGSHLYASGRAGRCGWCGEPRG